jgi:hypothetical protein
MRLESYKIGRLMIQFYQRQLAMHPTYVETPRSMCQSFGPTNLGQAGLTTLFVSHTCNQNYIGKWSRPEGSIVYFNDTKGTTMINVPTCESHV